MEKGLGSEEHGQDITTTEANWGWVMSVLSLPGNVEDVTTRFLLNRHIMASGTAA
jgi:hypothetical protein